MLQGLLPKHICLDSADNEEAVREFQVIYGNDELLTCKKFAEYSVIDIETVEKCIGSLKCNKSAGGDRIVAEHIIHTHPAIVVHLKLLFSMMLTHGYVLEDLHTRRTLDMAS